MSNKFADLGFEPIEKEDSFEPAFKRTLGFEGGYTVDHAGPTNLGITQSTYDNWRKKQGLPPKPVKMADTNEAKQLYKDEYFDKPGFSKLPTNVAGVLFDYGVNAGTARAAMALQKAVGASPDGVIGPKTLNTVNSFVSKNGEKALLQRIVDDRSKHNNKLITGNPGKFKKFANGWNNRINAIKAEFKLSDLNPFSVSEASASDNEFTDLGFEEVKVDTPQSDFSDLGFVDAVPQLRQGKPGPINDEPMQPTEADFNFFVQNLADKMATTASGQTVPEMIKSKEMLSGIIMRTPMLAMAPVAPIASAVVEGLNQAKNLIVSSVKKEKYSPIEIRVLNELLPKETPTAVRIAAMGGEALTDVALLGGLSNLAKQGLLKDTIKEIGMKLERAGYGTGQKTINMDVVKEAARGSTLDIEAERWLKAKLGDIKPKNKIGTTTPESPVAGIPEPTVAPKPATSVEPAPQKTATTVERAAQHGEVVGIDAKSGLPVIDTSVKPEKTFPEVDRRNSDLIPQPTAPKNRLSDWTPILNAYDDEGKKYQIAKLDVPDTVKAKLLDHYGLLFDKPVEAAQTTTPNLTPKQTVALAPSTENIITENGGDLSGQSKEGQSWKKEDVLTQQGADTAIEGKAPVSLENKDAINFYNNSVKTNKVTEANAPDRSFNVGRILDSAKDAIGTKINDVLISAKKIAHIYKQRPIHADFIINNIDEILRTDDIYRNVSNKGKIRDDNSYFFVKRLHKNFIAVVEVNIGKNGNEIRTIFTKPENELKKLEPFRVQALKIGGAPITPILGNEPLAAGRLSTLQSSEVNIAQSKENVKQKADTKKYENTYTDEDKKDISTLTDIEINMPNGEKWTYNLSDSSETQFSGNPSGHSETMQAIGIKESFKILAMAQEGKPLTALQKKKVDELLADFRANIKPSLERIDNEISKTANELTQSETEEVIRAFEDEEGANKPTSQEESNVTPSGQIRPELLPPEKKELFQEEGELFKKSKGDPASLKPPTVSQIKAASSPQEFEKRIEQLNKFGQANAILRRAGKLKFAAGRYDPKANTVKLDEETLLNNQSYMQVIGHELGHAIEKNVTGKISQRTKGTTGFDLFGKDADKAKIREELIAVSEDVAGKEAMLAKPDYYFQSTELIARFFEKMIFSPGNLKDLAPTAVEAIELQAIKHPIIQEFLLAASGGIDKGTPKFALLRDMRETYQKHLGKFVGNRAYDQEIVYRAMKERAKIVLEKFINDKMKMVKDAPESLFRAAESIKISRGGVPEFGTRDFAIAKTPEEEQALILNDYVKTPMPVIEDGVAYPQYAKQRYTPEEGKAIFDSLSENGKKLILDFTAERKEAKDFFNREVIKETYKIKSQLEGWVHHYFDDRPGSPVMGGKKFKTQVAGSRKQRTGTEGYVEDFKKAMTKALVDLEGERAFNDFITDFLAMVTKPLGKGQTPDPGWVEVVGNLKTGVGLPIEKRSTVIDSATGESVPMTQSRYQMPKEIYERYKMWRGLVDEASLAVRVVNDLNRYWRINILFHPGTSSTNYNSGAIQYSTKILTDFYREVLTGNLKMPDTQANISAMLKVLLPKGWNDAPDWVYGGDLSNFYGQFMKQKSPISQAIDTYGNNALKLFGLVERYWKKTIMLSEGVSDLKSLNEMTPEGLRVPTKEEEEMIAAINEAVDLYGYDYDNVAAWLEAHQKSVLGQAIKPFAKYPYKYAKQILRMVGDAFDQSLPWQDRVAKILALTTIVAAYAAFSADRKKKQKTPVADKSLDIPARLQTRGRVFITTDDKGREIFTRVSKYPFFNLTEAGMQFVDGNWETGKDVVSDMLGSLGPAASVGLLAFNYRNKYQQYEKPEVILGENIATFLPGYRILNDISRALDPFQRKQETFGQTFTQLIPTTDADLQNKLHGKIRTERVPIEGDVNLNPEGKRTTVDVNLENVKEDILLSLFTGIYRTRLDPKVVEAYIIRKQKNLDKKNAKQ